MVCYPIFIAFRASNIFKSKSTAPSHNPKGRSTSVEELMSKYKSDKSRDDHAAFHEDPSKLRNDTRAILEKGKITTLFLWTQLLVRGIHGKKL